MVASDSSHTARSRYPGDCICSPIPSFYTHVALLSRRPPLWVIPSSREEVAVLAASRRAQLRECQWRRCTESESPGGSLSQRSAARSDDRCVEPDSTSRAEERGVAVGEHPTVGGHRPIPIPACGRQHRHDRLVEGNVAGGTEETGITEGEDAAIGGDQPIPSPVSCRRPCRLSVCSVGRGPIPRFRRRRTA